MIYAINLITFDYHLPKNMYRALIEDKYHDKNIFFTFQREIGILFWNIHNITSLSIMEEYYEEFFSSFKEFSFIESKSSSLKICLYLFWDFILIAQKRFW